MKEELGLSIDQKVHLAFNLAHRLGELENEGKIKLDDEDSDVVWGHADGLKAKRLDDMKFGRCSLQASIDFDLQKEEEQLDKEIKMFNELLENQEEL